jgi:hypothetical protein
MASAADRGAALRQHQSILEYRRGHYLKLALVLCAGAVFAYAWHEPPVTYLKPYGGTWLGYTLGTVCAVLVLWLMMLGVRKRSYRSTTGTVQGWTSAHVYIGTSLILLASLHCAFEFGWNVHTLAYALMVVVIASGFFGVYAYIRYPEMVTSNLAGETLETMLLKLADLDRKCRQLALDLPDEVNTVVIKASRAPREMGQPGGAGWWMQIMNTECRVRAACDALMKFSTRNLTPAQVKANEQLIAEMTRKAALTDRVRRDLRFRRLLQVWLYLHVPLSFALLAALIAHVISVFYFW